MVAQHYHSKICKFLRGKDKKWKETKNISNQNRKKGRKNNIAIKINTIK